MLETGCNLGGEQSGHIIFSDHATTGDGEMTAVQLLNIVRASGKTLGQLADEIELYPQILINVRVSALGKLRLDEDAEIRNAIAYAEEQLGGEGRVLLDGSKWAALGAVKIREGATLDLGGTTAEDLFVTGGGTLANGTVSGGVAISLKEDGSAADDVLPLLSNISFAGPGRVKLELTGGALLPPYRTVAVARYEGAAPDVGSWRLVKNPADRTLGAKFTAENGKVYMTPGKYGTVLIVR